MSLISGGSISLDSTFKGMCKEMNIILKIFKIKLVLSVRCADSLKVFRCLVILIIEFKILALKKILKLCFYFVLASFYLEPSPHQGWFLIYLFLYSQVQLNHTN